MAHFFDPLDNSPLKELKVAVHDVALVGLKLAGGQHLNVTTWGDLRAFEDSDPAVRLVHSTFDEEVYEVVGLLARSNKLRACRPRRGFSSQQNASILGYDGNALPFAPDVEIALHREPNVSGKANVRKHIVDLARSFVGRSHYLWGTAGNRPGFADGNHTHARAATIRPARIDAAVTLSASPASGDADTTLGIRQAAQGLFDGYNSCAGRSALYQGSFTQAELDEYLKARKADREAGKSDRLWPGMGPSNLYPRRFWKSFHEDGKLKGKMSAIVYGEPCQDVHHFDCVGLVNYCYAHYWRNPPVEIAIVDWPNFAREATNDGNLMDADIVIPKDGGHIAMIYDAGGGTWKVVQAEETIKGLTDSESYKPSKWDRYRVPASSLIDHIDG